MFWMQSSRGNLTVKVAIDQAAGVIVIVHGQDGAARDEGLDLFREGRLTRARGPCQAHLRQMAFCLSADSMSSRGAH